MKDENKKNEEEYEYTYDDDNEDQLNEKRPIWVKIIVGVVLLSFVFLAFSGVFRLISLPSIGFLQKSGELGENEEIKDLKKSVVEVKSSNKSGTGFNISKDGLIITNHHVIDNANNIELIFKEDGIYYVKSITSFPEIDIAIIDIDGDNLPYLEFEDEKSYNKGDKVYTIGNPLGFSHIAHDGIITGYTKLNDWENPVMMIENPSIQKGSSGSPVFNKEGKVIAVIFATYIYEDENEKNTALAIPLEDILKRIN